MKRSFLVFAVLLALSACGGGRGESSMAPAVRQHLLSGVEAVEEAAGRHDRPAAEDALASLHRDVAAAQAEGKLDPSRTRTILDAAERVAEDVRMMPMPAPEPPVTVTVPTPVPNTDEQQQEQQEERGRGNGTGPPEDSPGVGPDGNNGSGRDNRNSNAGPNANANA